MSIDTPVAPAVIRRELRPSARRAPAATLRPEFVDAINRFLQNCHRKQYAPKSMIIRQGDPTGELFYVVEGSVKVLLEDDEGHEIVLAYLNGGEFFGELGLFHEDNRRSALVRARTRCEVAQISYPRLRAMGDVFPELMFLMNAQLAERLKNMNRKFGNLAFMDVYGRIARALLELCKEPDAVTHPDGMLVRVTRQELARIVGCSREMVGRVLKQMEDAHQVVIEGRSVIVFGTR